MLDNKNNSNEGKHTMVKRTVDKPASQDTSTLTNPNAIAVNGGGAKQQNTARKIGLILTREYKNRLRQTSYKVSTIILALSVFIGICVPTVIAYFTSHSGHTQTHITLVNNAGPIAGLDDMTLNQYFTKALNGSTSNQSSAGTASTTTSQPASQYTIKTSIGENINTLKDQVKNGKLDILLVVERDTTKDLHFTYYTSSSTGDDTNSPRIQSVANQLSILDKSSRLGLSAAQTQSLFTPPAFSVVSTQTAGKNDLGTQLSSYFLGLAGVILIFMAITLYGSSVATGVAEEKGTRIMEILINAATPFQLMAGKILGIGAAGLVQLVIIVATGIVGFLLQHPLGTLLGVDTVNVTITLNATTSLMFVLLLVYFILGFLLYASLFAAVGALVQRTDEVQSASAPITTLVMIGYLVSIGGGSAGIANPNGAPTWFRIMSLIPFFTPTMMLMRAGSGAISAWEIGLSIVLLILAILACTWIAARIYRYGVLMYGQKPKLGQLIKIVRQ
jgi:ABC-2 type transport system permease protein